MVEIHKRSSRQWAVYICLIGILLLFGASASKDEDAVSSGGLFQIKTPSIGGYGRRLLNQLLQKSAFPYGNCVRNTETPYHLDFHSSTPRGEELEHCFVVRERPCDPGTRCCSVLGKDFFKIEIEVKKKCLDAVTSITFNGETRKILRTSQFATGTVRITDLQLQLSTAIGKRFCFRTKAPCRNLADLCETGTPQCRAAITDNPQKQGTRCCPLQLIGPPPPAEPQPSPSAACMPITAITCLPVTCRQGSRVNLHTSCTPTPSSALITPADVSCANGTRIVTASVGSGAGAGCLAQTRIRLMAVDCDNPPVTLTCKDSLCSLGSTLDFATICSTSPAGAFVMTPPTHCSNGTFRVAAGLPDSPCIATSDVTIKAVSTQAKVTVTCTNATCTPNTPLEFSKHCKVTNGAKIIQPAITCPEGRSTWEVEAAVLSSTNGYRARTSITFLGCYGLPKGILCGGRLFPCIKTGVAAPEPCPEVCCEDNARCLPSPFWKTDFFFCQ